jgi:hypothetical protein
MECLHKRHLHKLKMEFDTNLSLKVHFIQISHTNNCTADSIDSNGLISNQSYHFKYLPSSAVAPNRIAPLQPRLDHQLFYHTYVFYDNYLT